MTRLLNFLQGLKPGVRKEAWKYLLGFYPFEMTDIERMELRERRESEYWTMKNQWQSFTPDQENRFAKWRELKHLISKLLIIIIRGEPERAPNTRGTGRGFICIYIYIFVCL